VGESDTIPLRVWVLIDHQNVYNDARRAFFDPDNDAGIHGNFNPRKLAERLASQGPTTKGRGRSLDRVMVYRGMPSNKRDPKGYSAARRRKAAWVAAGVQVFDRPLRYPDNYPKRPAEEKGIDVALAVDLVYHGLRRNYDAAVVASTDTDLVPALEAICEQTRAWGSPHVEVMTWKCDRFRKRLRVDQTSIYCHWLDRVEYDAVADLTNYGSSP
jgi:uncharacterized LabA/DUF88 family protein